MDPGFVPTCQGSVLALKPSKRPARRDVDLAVAVVLAAWSKAAWPLAPSTNKKAGAFDRGQSCARWKRLKHDNP